MWWYHFWQMSRKGWVSTHLRVVLSSPLAAGWPSRVLGMSLGLQRGQHADDGSLPARLREVFTRNGSMM